MGLAFGISNKLPRAVQGQPFEMLSSRAVFFKPLTHATIPEVQGLGGRLGACARV